MRDLLSDVRYGVRGLIKAPTFSLLTVMTLTLAIGVNSAIFSMVSAIFLADLPMDDPDLVVFVNSRNPQRGSQRGPLSLPEFDDVRLGVGAFEGVAAVRTVDVILTGVEAPVRVRALRVTPSVFPVWGTSPLHGRAFTEQEGRPDAEPAALITHNAWQVRFGGDPDIVGRMVSVDGQPTTIVGVLRSEIEFGDIGLAEIWLPLTDAPADAPRDRRDLFVTGRLRVGATVEQANLHLAAVNERAREQFPQASAGTEIYAQSFIDGLADDGFWTILFMLGLTVTLVMLIACSNVATMLMARGSVRARELAVRSALGAGRARIVRQLLTESAVLSIVAGGLGLLAARGTLMALSWAIGDNGDSAGFINTLAIDRNVLGFTLAVALAAPLVFALVPALRAVRSEIVDTLKEGRAAGGGVAAVRGRRFLVAMQVSMALVLMAVAGLLIDAMMRARAVDPGFDTGSVLTMRVDLPAARYPDPATIVAFRRALTERVERLPGVRDVAWIDRRNLADGGRGVGMLIDGKPEPLPEEIPFAFAMQVEPPWFEIVGLFPVAGRLLDERDDLGAAPVAVVNQSAVDRYWGGDDPIGGRIRVTGTPEDAWIEVVGVSTNAVYPDPDEPIVPEIYLPIRQAPDLRAALLIAASGDPMTLAAPVRELVWELDAEQPVSDVRTVARIHDDELASMSAVIGMLAGFALFALLMAAGGIYGVLSFAVAQRTQEFGIRMALGAQVGSVRRMVVRNSALLIGGGMLAGTLGAVALARVLAAGIPEIEPGTTWVYAAVAGVLGIVAAVSIWVPALRATRIDPVIALRTE